MGQDTLEKPSNVWGIHSSKDNQPLFRGWAKSEGEAKKKLEEIRRGDGQQADEKYWVTRLTENQVRGFQAAGAIPKDA